MTSVTFAMKKKTIFCIELDTQNKLSLFITFNLIIGDHKKRKSSDLLGYLFTWFPIYSLTFSVTDERESRQWQVWRLQWKNPIFCIELDTSDERMQLQLLFSEKVMKEKKNLTQSDVTFNFLWQPTIMPADKMLLCTVYILGQYTANVFAIESAGNHRFAKGTL